MRPTICSVSAKADHAADWLKSHQKDLLDAVVAEVRGMDLKKRVMHDHEYIVEKSSKEIITDIETLINNSTGV